jgi:hypothetical protein
MGCGDVVVGVAVVVVVLLLVVVVVVVVVGVVLVVVLVVVMVVVVVEVVVVVVPVVVAPRGRPGAAARAVATPRAAITTPSTRSKMARRIARVWRSSYLFAPTDLGGCPCPVETARPTWATLAWASVPG